MFDLTGRKALVTGASGSIGSAIATALHAAGAHVAISGTRESALTSLADTLGGERVTVAPANLADPEEPQRLAGDVDKAVGGIDILVNNAGILRDNLSMVMKDDQWEEVIALNLTAGFKLTRACLRGMMKRRFGRVIGISSVAGVMGNPGQANYSAAKAGMMGFSKSVAREVASRGITVNTVAPGLIESAINESLTDKQRETILAAIPLGRLGSAEEVAASVLYLASDEAAYMTGQTLHLNGGMAMV
ncbi:MAG: beta-ketoacyl-ACP reductase [Pseudomonadota bacterium]